MDRQEGLPQEEAAKSLKERYTNQERRLAELKFWHNRAIIDGGIRKLNPEYLNLATARKVATAVLLMEIIYPKRVKWNKAELKKLFNEDPKKRQ
jgi:DNA topoisomerase VI subunit A